MGAATTGSTIFERICANRCPESTWLFLPEARRIRGPAAPQASIAADPGSIIKVGVGRPPVAAMPGDRRTADPVVSRGMQSLPLVSFETKLAASGFLGIRA
jgi:hypothetical protein